MCDNQNRKEQKQNNQQNQNQREQKQNNQQNRK